MRWLSQEVTASVQGKRTGREQRQWCQRCKGMNLRLTSSKIKMAEFTDCGEREGTNVY